MFMNNVLYTVCHRHKPYTLYHILSLYIYIPYWDPYDVYVVFLASPDVPAPDEAAA